MSKPASCLVKRKGKPCGECARCRKRIVQARWRATHAKENADYSRAYYEAHKEEYLARSRAAQKANPKRHAKHNAAWRKKKLEQEDNTY